MSDDPRAARFGGGFFIAAGAIIGVLIGRQYGETSLGLLGGLGVGTLLAFIPVLIDRRRGRRRD